MVVSGKDQAARTSEDEVAKTDKCAPSTSSEAAKTSASSQKAKCIERDGKNERVESGGKIRLRQWLAKCTERGGGEDKSAEDERRERGRRETREMVKTRGHGDRNGDGGGGGVHCQGRRRHCCSNKEAVTVTRGEGGGEG